MTLRAGRQRLVYLLGPDANALVFRHDEWFRAHEAMAAMEIVDGPTSVVLSDGEDHTRRRSLIRPSLAPRRIDGYVQTMAEAADEALTDTVPGRSFDAYLLFRRAIRRSTLRVLFGGEIAARADDLGDMLQPLLDLTDKLPQVLDWHRRLGTPAWRRGRVAQAAIDTFVYSQIGQERARTVPGQPSGRGEVPGPHGQEGVLQFLVHGRDGTGSGLTDQEIRDQVVTMIAAGYETTGSAMGWIVYLLGKHHGWQRRARDEADSTVGGRTPSPDDLHHLPVVKAVINEALRLYPPAMISVRCAVTGFEHAGCRIRPGDLVIFSPYATHRDPHLYKDPLRFDPERWLSGPGRPPEEFLPFGGGRHRCIGSGLAMAELTVMTSRLLTSGAFTLDQEPATARGFAAMRPYPGVKITMTA